MDIDMPKIPEDRGADNQLAFAQVICSSGDGAAWVWFTRTPAVVLNKVRRGTLLPGASPLLLSVAPLELAQATDDDLVRGGAWICRGWVAAADLHQAGLQLVTVGVTVQVGHAPGTRRAARRRRQRSA
jgi:hypothetical protein